MPLRKMMRLMMSKIKMTGAHIVMMLIQLLLMIYSQLRHMVLVKRMIILMMKTMIKMKAVGREWKDSHVNLKLKLMEGMLFRQLFLMGWSQLRHMVFVKVIILMMKTMIKMKAIGREWKGSHVNLKLKLMEGMLFSLLCHMGWSQLRHMELMKQMMKILKTGTWKTVEEMRAEETERHLHLAWLKLCLMEAMMMMMTMRIMMMRMTTKK